MICFFIVGATFFESLPTFKISGFLETSWAYFSGWGKKYLKTVLWRSPGLTFRAGARNALKLSSGGTWAHFPGCGQKCFKTVLWKLPGLTFRAGARNASELSSGRLLGSLSGWCSTNPMFDKPMFKKPCVQQTLCSTNLMFNTSVFNKIMLN